jgi:hypothetical protein
MALQLSKTLRNGTSAEYWAISPNMIIDVVAQTVSAQIWLYATHTARTGNKSRINLIELEERPNIPQTITLSGQAAIDAIKTGDPRTALYTVAKALEFFAGATDV